MRILEGFGTRILSEFGIFRSSWDEGTVSRTRSMTNEEADVHLIGSPRNQH